MINFPFYKKLNEECDVRLPYSDEQDWEWCAGNYKDTDKYIDFYNNYSAYMENWDKHLLINMIIQGIEDLMDESSEDLSYINSLWIKAKKIIIRDNHEYTIIYWSCIGEESEDCWNITPMMRQLLSTS